MDNESGTFLRRMDTLVVKNPRTWTSCSDSESVANGSMDTVRVCPEQSSSRIRTLKIVGPSMNNLRFKAVGLVRNKCNISVTCSVTPWFP